MIDNLRAQPVFLKLGKIWQGRRQTAYKKPAFFLAGCGFLSLSSRHQMIHLRVTIVSFHKDLVIQDCRGLHLGLLSLALDPARNDQPKLLWSADVTALSHLELKSYAVQS